MPQWWSWVPQLRLSTAKLKQSKNLQRFLPKYSVVPSLSVHFPPNKPNMGFLPSQLPWRNLHLNKTCCQFLRSLLLFRWVVKFCLPIDCSMPGFPVLHYLTEFAQTHVLWVGDAIQPCHPLLPSFAFSLSQQQGLFQWVSSLYQVAKVLELQL